MYFPIKKNTHYQTHKPPNIFLALANIIQTPGNSPSNYDCIVKESLLQEETKTIWNERISVTGNFHLYSSEKLDMFTKAISGRLQGSKRNKSDPLL